MLSFNVSHNLALCVFVYVWCVRVCLCMCGVCVSLCVFVIVCVRLSINLGQFAIINQFQTSYDVCAFDCTTAPSSVC